ncbi:MAG TPA: hypothetical protein VJN18_23320 [Polyangiaceae bacterium]|nr:hypothetical protein [Polyangiaceae bacterium]
MTALIASRRALCALTLSASACAVYGPELVQLPPEGGSGGASGSTAGSRSQGATSPGGSGGDLSTSGTAGEPTSGSGGEGGQPPEPETVPFLRVAITPPFTDVTLTTEGALDWAHWGLGSATDRNQRAGVTSLLLDFKPTGSTQAMRFLDGPTTFNWTDGTPTVTASTNDGISWQGVGEGFELVVPAVVDIRKLKLYLAVFDGTGALQASLSDPRASSIGDNRITNNSAIWHTDVITIDYGNATLPDTTMTVSFSMAEGNAPNAAVALTAMSIGNGVL